MPRIDIPSGEEAGPHAWSRLAPEITAAARGYSTAVYAHSQLALREMEGMRARIAEINGCQACGRWRAARDLPTYLERFGETPDSRLIDDGGDAPDEAFYAAVSQWRTSALFSGRERLAIEFGERMALDHRSLEDDERFWERLHAVFSDADLVDMAFSAGAYIAFGRINRVLDIDGACRIPAAAA